MKIITNLLLLVILFTYVPSNLSSSLKTRSMLDINENCIRKICSGSGTKLIGSKDFPICQVGVWHYHAIKGQKDQILFKKNGKPDYYCKCSVKMNKVRSCVHNEKGGKKSGCSPSRAAVNSIEKYIRRC